MSYTNQTTSSVADFVSKLNTFLSGTPGWTTHHNAAGGEFAARKTGASFDIGFASQWDTASARYLGLYHFHGAAYNSGASPWAQNNDSGNGAASTSNASLALQRRADLGAGGPQEFWCFEDDDYFHVVVRHTDTLYVHFGAGVLDKFNDYTGGEYVYGHLQVSTSTNSAISGQSSILLDGLLVDGGAIANAEEYAATMHLEGMLNQGGSTLWAVCMGNQSSATLGTDRAANARMHVSGGYRGGPFPHLFGNFVGTTQRGLVPLYPIVPFHWDRTSGDIVGPLGQMKDVRGISLNNFAAEEEITIGSDTWVLFPSSKKSDTMGLGQLSGYQGIAYKKVTT